MDCGIAPIVSPLTLGGHYALDVLALSFT